MKVYKRLTLILLSVFSSNVLAYKVTAVCDAPKGKSITYYSKYKPIQKDSFWDKLFKSDFTEDIKEKTFIESPDGWHDGSSLTLTWDSNEPKAKAIYRQFFKTLKDHEGLTQSKEFTPIQIDRNKLFTFAAVDSPWSEYLSLYPIEKVGVLSGHTHLDINDNAAMYSYNFHMKCTITIE